MRLTRNGLIAQDWEGWPDTQQATRLLFGSLFIVGVIVGFYVSVLAVLGTVALVGYAASTAEVPGVVLSAVVAVWLIRR